MGIGTRIRELRRKARLTQKELGEKIGRTESSIRKYEKGLVEIPLSVLKDIASVLSVSINEILGNSEDEEVKFVITPKGIAWVSLREVGIDIPEGVFNAFWILFEDKMKSLGYIYEGQQ